MIFIKNTFSRDIIYILLAFAHFFVSSVFHFNQKCLTGCVQVVISVEQVLEWGLGQVINQRWLECFLSTAVRKGLCMCYTEARLAWESF